MTKVLIVDDDTTGVETLSNVLEIKGYRVDAAYGGMEALEKIGRTNFDFVLLDLKLPDINGVETFRKIKKVKDGLKVVIMTAYSLPHLIQEARKEGALAILTKPLNIDKLLSLLK